MPFVFAHRKCLGSLSWRDKFDLLVPFIFTTYCLYVQSSNLIYYKCVKLKTNCLKRRYTFYMHISIKKLMIISGRNLLIIFKRFISRNPLNCLTIISSNLKLLFNVFTIIMFTPIQLKIPAVLVRDPRCTITETLSIIWSIKLCFKSVTS